MKPIIKNQIYHLFKVNYLILGLIILFFVLSCSGGDSEPNNMPSNLVLNVTIVGSDTSNPNGDGSGVLLVSASAKNAVRYAFRFENGMVQDSQSGLITQTVSKKGVHSYTIVAWAYAETGEFVNETLILDVYRSDQTFTSLVFSDEFDVDGAPNPANWVYDLGDGGWGNNESQTYTNDAENVIVEDGILKITAKDNGAGGYTSARLKSENLQEFVYGRVEVRAKLPAAQGTWPAIWMLGANFDTVGWSACGEIDIMEQTGQDKSRTSGAVHFPNNSGGNAPTDDTENEFATTEFHNYSVEWTENEIKLAVDDEVFFSFANTASTPFNNDFFFILNVAMGGTLGGVIDPAFTEDSMEVDYIRVYQ